MKKGNRTILPLSILVLAFCIGGCSKEGSDKQHFNYGEKISFIAGSVGTGTKTVYAGSSDDGSERIDWEKNDLVRIYCGAVSSPDSKYADFSVKTGGARESEIEEYAGALYWGSGDHTFYAVYPSPLTVGKESDVLGNGTLKGYIPRVQKPRAIQSGSGGVTFLAKTDMINQYMVARTTVTEASSLSNEGIELEFIPITTTIGFILKNDFAKKGDLEICSVELTSEKNALYGGFTADLTPTGWNPDNSNNPYPACTKDYGAESGGNVSVDFSQTDASGHITLKYGQSLQFNMFIMPVSGYDELLFSIHKADGSTMSTRLKADFKCHEKSTLSGVLVPEGGQWTIKYGPQAGNWGGETGELYMNPEIQINTFVSDWIGGTQGNLDLF